MADSTFGVKVSEETKEKVSRMIEASGMTSKEWFESVLRLVEVQQLKEEAKDFSKDLSELEVHTNRINQLVANMVQRAVHEKEDVERKIEEIKASKDNVILGLQKENGLLQERLEQMKEEYQRAQDEREEAFRQRNQLQEAVESHRALMAEYKEKIDTLSGLVAEYQSAAQEGQALREENRSLQQALAQAKKEIERVTAEAQRAREALENKHAETLAQLQEKHKLELERLAERKEIEKERELLRVRAELQDKQQKMIEAYTQKIESLYEELRKQNRPNT